MILFFGAKPNTVYAVQTHKNLPAEDISKLNWLFGNLPSKQSEAQDLGKTSLSGFFVGPRAAMISPWSTNAVEITQVMNIAGIVRIEEFMEVDADYHDFDPMLFQKYEGLDQNIFTIEHEPDRIKEIADIEGFNRAEGLALSTEEIDYLEQLSKKLGRKLTDSEVFGFSQINSEHCRHKIFNGKFIIDGQEKSSSLFKLIKKTSEVNPNGIVSAYKDNVAFIKGPKIEQFAPKSPDKPDYYRTVQIDSVISLKAETHNFPTTVEPFNGAATGSGGEIRDRLAGGKGSLPLAGTAVYMTSYPRLEKGNPNSVRTWENNTKERKWLYQSPMDILIKASNGASDFGNKFGQPLIAGSVLTFEHEENHRPLGFDKAIMLAGGIGYTNANQAIKEKPGKGDKIVVLGGENYRIGMGGAAVSSADTGNFDSGIELNAIQRSNPEMQNRVARTIRGMVESEHNPILTVHDHGAGGHLNCLSELVEDTGGNIELDELPVGDKTLSAKEIIGNESQERMGLIISEKDFDNMKTVADRERSPMYSVGRVTDDKQFTFESKTTGDKPMDLSLIDMFGSSPKTIMIDKTISRKYRELVYETEKIHDYLNQVLQLEAVACKDWLTNKVDRCVTGRVAKQQTAGSLQLPLNNCGVMALDYKGKEGVATSIGHSPISALVDPIAGSRNSIAEALTNIIWASLEEGLKSVSLSANWMWPSNNEGEDARLYEAVQAVSDFAIKLGINIPTGKDSLSMKQKYSDGEVLAPGTVIISAAAHCEDITKTIEPVLRKNGGAIYYLNFSKDSFKLGGSSFAQVLGKIGTEVPNILDEEYFVRAFNTVQKLIKAELIIAGHDVASGGLITTLLEMCFAENELGAKIDLSALGEKDTVKLLFSENSGIVFQTRSREENTSVEKLLAENKIEFFRIGSVEEGDKFLLKNNEENLKFDIPKLRDTWYKTSFLLDQKQSGIDLATERFHNYKKQTLQYVFPKHFSGKLPALNDNPRPKAAIIREKGSNGEREMAMAMYLAGFDVKDVHMTDLTSGRETLEDIQFIGAVGGFSNSDVLGSAKGWAGAFLYNEKANSAMKTFFEREDTLSIGICNGCQLFIEMGLINRDHEQKPKMLHNESHKFECVFTSVEIPENNSVMLSSLAGSKLGIWAAHGEGKFSFPYEESRYNIVAKYAYEAYPANPNGSHFNAAMLADESGRHLVTMPHFERSIFPWNWGFYPHNRKDKVSPWLEAFVNARKWLESK